VNFNAGDACVPLLRFTTALDMVEFPFVVRLLTEAELDIVSCGDVIPTVVVIELEADKDVTVVAPADSVPPNKLVFPFRSILQEEVFDIDPS